MKGIAFASSQGNNYFYDDDTGIIFPCDKEGNLIAPYAGRLAISPLGDRRPPPSGPDAASVRQHHLDQAYGFRHLILEVTGQCNLRCKYCIYSDHYPFNRTFNNSKMDFDTARAAVDLFMENHSLVNQRNPSSRPIIGFYGGEPLIAFDVIRETVEYFHKKYAERFDALFTLTTNGLLLSDAVGDFLTKYDFSIIVSLDGNKENHDRNRLRVNGRGSFDAVFANLQRFRRNHPGYKQLAISTCYDYKTDMDALMRFFDAEKLFVVNISQINPNSTTYYAQFTEDDKRCSADRYAAFQEMYLEAAKNGTIEKGSFLFSYIGVSFANFAFHPVMGERRPSFLPYTATCVPGEKLYVTSDSKIHMCERINDKFPIGTLTTGLDYSRIAEIIHEYNAKTCTHCAHCPVTRFCSRCFATTATDTSFELAEGFCAQTLASIKESLVSYVDIVEFRPDLLDDITVEYHRNLMEKVGYVVE